LKKIIASLLSQKYNVIFSSGLADLSEWMPLPENWLDREYFPQTAILKHCDLVISHGGNNTIMESLYNGLPLVISPFASDQFFGAASIERNKLGLSFDPNNFTSAELITLIKKALLFKKNTELIGKQLTSNPGEKSAVKLCEKFLLS